MDKISPQISIVIAAKNEEKNISGLLDSFKIIDYPANKFEIIIVDDNSTDNTLQEAMKYLNHFTNLRIIPAEDKKYPGKKGALALGIMESHSDLIIITDADCFVERDWLKSYIRKFNEGYDFLFGNAPFIEEPGFVNSIARFENIRTFFLYRSALKIKLPYSAAARNFGFRKSSYERIKGYENTTETLSGDDDLLIREAVKNKMRIGYVSDKESSVYSYAPASFKEYLIQKTRHTKTSLYYLPIHKIMLAAWHIINLLCLFSFPLGLIDKWLFMPAVVKIITDIIIVEVNTREADYKFRPFEIIYLQIIYEALIVVNFVNALFKGDKWK